VTITVSQQFSRVIPRADNGTRAQFLSELSDIGEAGLGPGPLGVKHLPSSCSQQVYL
jgi:hypothetical protein